MRLKRLNTATGETRGKKTPHDMINTNINDLRKQRKSDQRSSNSPHRLHRCQVHADIHIGID